MTDDTRSTSTPTPEAVRALLGSLHHDVVTLENREALRRHYAHPFLDLSEVGDMAWRVPRFALGDDLSVVWFRPDGVRGGFGRNWEPKRIGPVVIRGRQLVLEPEDGGESVDMVTGKKVW